MNLPHMFLKKIKIKNRIISDKKPTLIVAEISANHNNSLKETVSLIKHAAKSGVEAIKFQTFDLDEMTMNSKRNEFWIKNKLINKKWNKRSLYSIYREAQFPYKWHKKVFKISHKLGLICFSSVFDEKSLEFLEKLNCPAYKIASLESLHFSLIKKIASKNKPIIISTGTLTLAEIDSLIKFLKSINFRKLILLHCVTEYPANPKNINLKVISYIKEKYKCLTGFSDHTSGIGSAINSVGFGSCLIEKHFKLSNKSKSLDKDFSIDPKMMKVLIDESKAAWKSIGKRIKKISVSEKQYKKYRRSIYVSKNIKVGDEFSNDNLKIIRPGKGLDPRLLKYLIGKKSKTNFIHSNPLSKRKLGLKLKKF